MPACLAEPRSVSVGQLTTETLKNFVDDNKKVYDDVQSKFVEVKKSVDELILCSLLTYYCALHIYSCSLLAILLCSVFTILLCVYLLSAHRYCRFRIYWCTTKYSNTHPHRLLPSSSTLTPIPRSSLPTSCPKRPNTFIHYKWIRPPCNALNR